MSDDVSANADSGVGVGERRQDWWDDLPDGSVVLDADGDAGQKVDGAWWYGCVEMKPGPPFAWVEPITVIHVPVTDVEPPDGSIVQADLDILWKRGTITPHADPEARWVCQDPYLLYIRSSPSHETWAELRPKVARILRWGE